MLQMLVRVPDQIGDRAKVVLAGILREAGNASRIDSVNEHTASWPQTGERR